MKLQNEFTSAHDHKALNDLDYIEIAPARDNEGKSDDLLPEDTNRIDPRLIKIDTIIETGKVWQYGQPGVTDYDKSLFIDWQSDDAFTQALSEIREASFERIAQSEELQALLNQDQIDKTDRVQWEREISRIVNEEVDKIPGLDRYRTSAPNVEAAIEPEQRSARLNDLSKDIENASNNMEFDCEAISVVEGIILQQIDDRFWPNETNFYFAQNWSYDLDKYSPYDSIGHAYVVSSETGNVIEATNDPSELSRPAYKEHIDTDYSFADLVHGQPFITDNGDVYGERAYDFEQARQSMLHENPDHVYELISSDWTEQDIFNTPGQVLDPELDASQSLQLTDMAPEIARLANIKAQIERLDQQRGATEKTPQAKTPGRDAIDSKIQALRAEFDEDANNLIRDWGVQGLSRAIIDAERVYFEHKLADSLHGKLQEMFPHNSDAEINNYLNHLKDGTLPDIGKSCFDPNSEDAVQEFIDLKTEKLFKERFPDSDFEHAKELYENTIDYEIFNSLDNSLQYIEFSKQLKHGEIAPDDPELEGKIGLAAKYRSVIEEVELKYSDIGDLKTTADMLANKYDKFQKRQSDTGPDSDKKDATPDDKAQMDAGMPMP